jgi:hypothetical protein
MATRTLSALQSFQTFKRLLSGSATYALCFCRAMRAFLSNHFTVVPTLPRKLHIGRNKGHGPVGLKFSWAITTLGIPSVENMPIRNFTSKAQISEHIQHRRKKTAPPRVVFTASRNCLDFGKKCIQKCLEEQPTCAISANTWAPTRLIKLDDPLKVKLVYKTDLDYIVQ